MAVKVKEKIKGSGVYWLFIDHRGRRTSRKVGSQKAAEKAKVKIEAKLTLGEWLPEEKPALPTVQDYYDDVFLPDYVENPGALAQSTSASYKKNFNTHILPALGCYRLDECRDHMEGFIRDLCKKAPRMRQKKEGKGSKAIVVVPKPEPKTLAKDTIETIVKQTIAFFNYAKERKKITDNPATGLSQFYSQAPIRHEVVEPLTREEVPIFLATVQKHAKPDYALFFTAIHTGLRAGELAGLQTGDLDFHGNFVIVRRSIDRVHRKVKRTKTERIRRVDLSDELAAVLKEHIRQQKEYWFRKGRPQPEWLFPNEDGGWQDMANLSEDYFHPCLTKAGLHQRPFHHLRHTFASLLLTNGAPMQYVSEQLGHANIQLTVKLYGHLQKAVNRHWMNTLAGATLPAAAEAAQA